jgi:hypothetical protein
MRQLAAIAITILLVGCQSSVNYAAIDPTQRTMTIPPGSTLLLSPIKQALIRAGWKLNVDPGPYVTRGTLGDKTNLASGGTFLTRYRLVISQRQTDICVVPPLEPQIVYDLSVIDNQSGQEVMTQHGSGCVGLDNAAEKFVRALEGAH